MKLENGYGVVYTPDLLSDFVARLLIEEYYNDCRTCLIKDIITILDPACGEAALLKAAKRVVDGIMPNCVCSFIGVDIDKNIIDNNNNGNTYDSFRFYEFNALLPQSSGSAADYWIQKFGKVPLIIANPPWSSEKIFDKAQLASAGFTLYAGQYDSYVLFIELCLKIIEDGGYMALIIPDSIFAGENKELRKFLLQNTELRVIARLGERLFPDVNRATTIMIVKKTRPTEKSTSKCFRLNTAQRKAFFLNKVSLYTLYSSSKHKVFQKRFNKSPHFVIDVDTRQEDEKLLSKIEDNAIDWNKTFHFGRGVEISKSGLVVVCPNCNMAQGYSKKQSNAGKKACSACGAEVLITAATIDKIISTSSIDGFQRIYVGENLRRYGFYGINYLKMGVAGINYKEPKLYEPPKILIRKTGLGINACIDYESTYISQTIYSCNYIDNSEDTPLEYYLGVLNSRIIYYYYLKKYGENEWKSHPYLTKEVIFSFPIKTPTNENLELCREIAQNVKRLQIKYTRRLDIKLEGLVSKLYGLNMHDINLIAEELNKLPDLWAINHMKLTEDEEDCLDILEINQSCLQK